MSSVQTHPAVQQAQDKAGYYLSQLDKELAKYGPANIFEQKTQIPKTYGAISAAVLVLVSLFINTLAHPISNLVGFVLPACLSIKAIESPGHEDDVQWLTYWVVFGTFTLIESVALRIALYYLPFYFVFKTIFILWLQLPATKGARTLYLSVLRPVLANNGKNNSSRPVPDTADTGAADLRAKVDSAL